MYDRTVVATARITPAVAEELQRDADEAGISRSEHIYNILEAATTHDPVYVHEIKGN